MIILFYRGKSKMKKNNKSKFDQFIGESLLKVESWEEELYYYENKWTVKFDQDGNLCLYY